MSLDSSSTSPVEPVESFDSRYPAALPDRSSPPDRASATDTPILSDTSVVSDTSAVSSVPSVPTTPAPASAAAPDEDFVPSTFIPVRVAPPIVRRRRAGTIVLSLLAVAFLAGFVTYAVRYQQSQDALAAANTAAAARQHDVDRLTQQLATLSADLGDSTGEVGDLTATVAQLQATLDQNGQLHAGCVAAVQHYINVSFAVDNGVGFVQDEAAARQGVAAACPGITLP